MVRQAQDNWITANLRKESGAAIPPAELEQERAKWFPQPGEGERTATQKERARAVAEEAMLTQTGPGKRLVQQNIDKTARGPQQAEALSLPANPTSSNLQRGKTYMLPNGKPATWDGMQFKAAK